MLLANSKQSVTMSEYQSCVIPSLSLCLKTNIQLINEHEECPLEQFEEKIKSCQEKKAYFGRWSVIIQVL